MSPPSRQLGLLEPQVFTKPSLKLKPKQHVIGHVTQTFLLL